MKLKLIFSLLLTLHMVGFIYAQENYRKLVVYFDCESCDINYLKRNFTEIDYAREAQVSDVHVLVTRTTTGSGGRNYIFNFIGRDGLKNLNYELSYSSNPIQTYDEIRKELSEVIKAGLGPFIYALRNSDATFKPEQEDKIVQNKDPWRNWVFRISSDFQYEKETNKREFEVENEIRIERVDEQWRIRSEFEHEYKQNIFKRNGNEFKSDLNIGSINGSIVKSLSNHFSVGLSGNIWRNTVNNIKLGSYLNPAIEYNFFDYNVSHVKEFTVAYIFGPRFYTYKEETIFDHTEQQLLGQALVVNYRAVKPWGDLEIGLEGFHFLNDFSKNRFEFESDLYVRLFKGLSLRLGTEAQLIHDQIFLPKGDASLEEILLERKALATDFRFEFSIGLSYVFGALSNNVVNTRL